ncbi:hypothetical protein [Streptomyces sp. TRM68367]|nr:hypothetical protein [Streptomyces sp. TRM68367]
MDLSHSHVPPLAIATSRTTAMEASQNSAGLPLAGRPATVGAG